MLRLLSMFLLLAPTILADTPPEDRLSNCSLYSHPSPPKTYGNGKIIDITHQIRAGLPIWGTLDKTTDPSYLIYGNVFRKDGSVKGTQYFEFHIPAHTSTHVDAPSHVFPMYEKACYGADSLDLDTLNGPALLVDVPRNKNITAKVMQKLGIPRGVKRVLFRTANTDKQLMWKVYQPDYTGFTADGAEWLVKYTDIKLVGIDFTSVAVSDQGIPTHEILLKSRHIIPLEGLNLYGIPAGQYDISCLPIRLLGADGAPTRCILIK